MFLLKYKLIYSVVFISGVQQNDSIIIYCVYLLHIIFHYGLSQDI